MQASHAKSSEDDSWKCEEGGHLCRGLQAQCSRGEEGGRQIAMHGESAAHAVGAPRLTLTSPSLPEQPRGPQVVTRSHEHAALDQARQRVHGLRSATGPPPMMATMDGMRAISK